MSLLAVSGDVGGARAIIPVLDYLYSDNEPFTIVNHSFLADEAPEAFLHMTANQAFDAVKVKHPSSELLEELTGFMVGWAYNAVRYCFNAQPKANPAIVEIQT